MPDAKQLRTYKIIYSIGYALLLLALICLVNKIYSPANGDPSQINKTINERNCRYAKGNPFGFTDKKRIKQKPHGVYRIAVLGDSFIWGDGIAYEKTWSHKLEARLLGQYDSIEVIHWGLNGWSTLDEFNFFKNQGKDYDVDLLIIAWVDNDPDIGKVPPEHPLDPAVEMPILNKICPPLAEAWVGHKEDVAYSDWTGKIYSKENVEEYKKVLKDFGRYIDSTQIRALFVMTPGPFDEQQEQHFKIMEPLLRNSGIPCYNLYLPLWQALHHYSNKELIANPVNSHPGEVMTEEMANDVETYLQKNHYLPGKRVTR